jgi:hypothetical protein
MLRCELPLEGFRTGTRARTRGNGLLDVEGRAANSLQQRGRGHCRTPYHLLISGTPVRADNGKMLQLKHLTRRHSRAHARAMRASLHHAWDYHPGWAGRRGFAARCARAREAGRLDDVDGFSDQHAARCARTRGNGASGTVLHTARSSVVEGVEGPPYHPHTSGASTHAGDAKLPKFAQLGAIRFS